MKTPRRLARRARRNSPIPTARDFFFSGATLDAEARAAREKAFFRSIRLRNGTYKTTYPGRLDSLNEIVNGVLPPLRPLEIMDVAVSSGVSTLEWMDCLRNSDIDFRMTAGDLCVRAFLLSFGRLGSILVDDTGYPLQFDIFGMPIRSPPRRRLAVLFPPLFASVHAMRWALPLFFTAVFKRSAVDDDATSVRRFGIGCRRTALISPQLLQQTSRTILDDDLLSSEPFGNQFDVIRAANILNRSYFSDETLRVMISNLRARLKRRGMLIICRTHDDGFNHGTIFRLNEADELDVVCRIGDGSEVESLVVDSLGRVGKEVRDATDSLAR